MRLYYAIVCCLLFFPFGLTAAEVVVVEAVGVSLKPGQVLDGTRPLKLMVGQRATLVAADGRIIKLKGPSDAAPAPEAEPDSGGVARSLRDLISARSIDTAGLGVMRSADQQATLPEPWLVDVLHGGRRCVREGMPVLFWRAKGAQQEADLQVAPLDRSWSAQAVWPAGADRLEIPGEMALRDQRGYSVSLDQASTQIMVFVIPASVKTDAAKLAWMLESHCDAQARALLRLLP